MPSSSQSPYPPIPPKEDDPCPADCVDDCPCPDENDPTSSDDCPPQGNSNYPVRYSSGQIQLSERDLSSQAFGLLWGHTRSYANVLSTNSVGMNGNSWLIVQLKALGFIDVGYGVNNPDEICVVEGGSTSRWFKRQTDGTYRPMFSGYDVLFHDSSRLEFVLVNKRGEQTVFYDNSSTQPHQLVGKLKAIIDKSGRTVTATYDSNGQITKFEQEVDGQVTGFYYDYWTTGILVGMLSSVTLKVRDQLVRRASYGYYEGESGGNLADLKSVAIQQYDPGTHSWKQVLRKHYRYYTQNNSIGFIHGLKYVIRGTAYQQMVDAGLNPETATEALLAQYANFYFEYDGNHRVTLERVEGGQKEFSFTYEANPTLPGTADVNVWNIRTVETLPDGNENRVYTNKAGQVILKIFKEVATSAQWYDYAQFDSRFHMVLRANSFAVASVTEPSSGSSTLVVNLKSTDGLIREYVFYTTTNSTTGAVEGYLEKETVKKGSGGTAIKVRKVEYDTHQAFGQTIYPLRAGLVFPEENTSESSAPRTSYSYTWYLDGNNNPTFQILEKITTYPVVSTAQNGTGVAGVESRVFDIFGQVNWNKNQRGGITYMAYDSVTSSMVQRIEDVDTSRMIDVPPGWQTVSGWGLHLVSDYINDDLGRMVQARGPWHEVQLCESDATVTPIRRVQYKAYLDEEFEVREALGYMSGDEPTADFRVVDPVTITRFDESNNVVDQIQSVRSCTCGPLTTGELFPQTKWARWTHNIYDTWGRLYARRVYFKIPVQGEGDADSNFLETISGYDVMGRPDRIAQPSGTITRTVYDARGLRVATWVGTDDSGATPSDPSGNGAAGNNMKPVWLGVYDNGQSGGDGNLTSGTLPVNDNAADDRVTFYAYDYRDRQVQVQSSDGIQDYFVVNTYDNLDLVIELARYHTSVSTANRTHDSTTSYDARQRIFEQKKFYVNTNGTLGDYLVADIWYDPNSNVIKQTQQGATAVTKTVFDSLDRPQTQYVVSEASSTSGTNTNSVVLDVVISQNENTYNDVSEIVDSTTMARFDDATGTGPLQGPDGAQPKSRNSHQAFYFDPISRLRFAANYGTYGGMVWERPDLHPASSDTVLVTEQRYAADGGISSSIDPQGTMTSEQRDQAGRRVQVIENASGHADEQRVSQFQYAPDGGLKRLTLLNPTTGEQVTTWAYGSTLANSSIASNNLPVRKIYPTGEIEAQTYNRQGEVQTMTDPNGSVHTYLRDLLGRLTDDQITTLASGVDGLVRLISTAYDERGRVQYITSESDPQPGIGSVINQTAYAYNGIDCLTSDAQSDSGAVNVNTPWVQYTCTAAVNHILRRTSTVYPNGRTVSYEYGDTGSVDDVLNRAQSVHDDDLSVLAEFQYLGAATPVVTSLP